jgi:NADH:ubiquinone oxidoreductase subunit 4 (subunit M)
MGGQVGFGLLRFSLRLILEVWMRAFLFVVAVIASAFLMRGALIASEQEDCWRLERQVRHGYPVTMPEWCEQYKVEEE